MSHITLQGVHNNISGAAGNLIRRQCISQLRIHDGKARTVQISIGTALFADFVVGQHRGIAGLAACCRNSQHYAYRGSLGNRTLAAPILPDIHLRVSNAVGYCLGSINNAAAAYCQNKISLELQRLLDTLSRQGHQRIWLDTANGIIRNACLLQLILKPCQETALDHAAAAIYHKHTAAPMLLHLFSRLFLGTLAKNNFRWAVILKALHKITPPVLNHYQKRN